MELAYLHMERNVWSKLVKLSQSSMETRVYQVLRRYMNVPMEAMTRTDFWFYR
jgi:hypothetical protein